MTLPTLDLPTIEADTRAWLERAVINLNLCPFAKSVYVKNQVHFVVSQATDADGLLAELTQQLKDLVGLPATVRDTTLLIVPQGFGDFLLFNDFLDLADGALDELDLHGTLQIANFHPDFQFAGTEPDDMGNFTNRSPYPTLHLIREESIDRAVAAFPNAEAIYEQNIMTLEKLGQAGWAALAVGATIPPSHD